MLVMFLMSLRITIICLVLKRRRILGYVWFLQNLWEKIERRKLQKKKKKIIL